MLENNLPRSFKFSWYDDLKKMVEAHPLTMIYGEPGGGKTTWAQSAALELTGKDPEILQGTPETEIANIWGLRDLEDGKLTFRPGALPRSLKNNSVLIIEEFNLIPIEIRSILLALRGQERITNPYTGEVISIPKTWRLIAISNPESMRCRKNSKIAQALFDDFLIIEIPTVSAEVVEKLLEVNFPDVNVKKRSRVVKLWKDYRTMGAGNENNIQLSYRSAEHLMKLLLVGMDENKAIEIALINKYILDADAHEAAKLHSSLS